MKIKNMINKIMKTYEEEETTHTVAEVRAKRKIENDRKAQTHKQTIGMLVDEAGKRVEKLKAQEAWKNIQRFWHRTYQKKNIYKRKIILWD